MTGPVLCAAANTCAVDHTPESEAGDALTVSRRAKRTMANRALRPATLQEHLTVKLITCCVSTDHGSCGQVGANWAKRRVNSPQHDETSTGVALRLMDNFGWLELPPH